jgi:hypothetical protein
MGEYSIALLSFSSVLCAQYLDIKVQDALFADHNIFLQNFLYAVTDGLVNPPVFILKTKGMFAPKSTFQQKPKSLKKILFSTSYLLDTLGCLVGYSQFTP